MVSNVCDDLEKKGTPRPNTSTIQPSSVTIESFIDDIKKRKNGISSSYDHYVDIKIIEEIWKKWLKK